MAMIINGHRIKGKLQEIFQERLKSEGPFSYKGSVPYSRMSPYQNFKTLYKAGIIIQKKHPIWDLLLKGEAVTYEFTEKGEEMYQQWKLIEMMKARKGDRE